MHLHEYQAKCFLKGFGIRVSDFGVIERIEELEHLLEEKGWDEVILKVQIHAGGRGKAGGVRKGNDPAHARETVAEMLGMTITNPQTGPEGVTARQLLVAPLAELEKEYYLGLTIDRSNGCVVLIASPEGGVEIEEVAATAPEKILRLPVPDDHKLRNDHLLELAKHMGWEGSLAEEGGQLAQGLVHAFFAADATLLEVNPLALTAEGHLEAIDAKLTIDDNALFRHPEFVDWIDPTQVPEREAEAIKHELAYVPLEGEIGCIVNGAGLAMATMDIILYHGGKPANFLDVGGGASREKVAKGFKIVLSDPQVKVILVNIFGGIMNCATLAQGMLDAFQEVGLHVPVVVRMLGTNVDEGKAILKAAKLPILTIDDFDEAAKVAVEQGK